MVASVKLEAPKLSTEALARASGRHPWITIGVWVLVLLIAAVLVFNLLGDVLTSEIDFTNNPESKRAYTLLEERLRDIKKANEIVIVRSETLTIDDPAFQGFVASLYSDIVALGSDIVEVGTHYYQFRDESLVSADRHTTILPFIMAGDYDDASDNIGQVHEVIGEADGESGFQVLITGEASVGEDFSEVADEDLQTAELIGIPIALVILVLVFGAAAAAAVPLALAIVSIVAALGATALIGQGFDFSFFIVNMITMMGLAVGIDYSLFIVSSGMVVVLALLGMLIVPLSVYTSLATGAILVLIAAVLSALTLLPAVLSLMGDKVNALRIPLIGRSSAKGDPEKRGSFWDWVARGVMRRPVVSLVLAAGLLIAAAVPAFSIDTGAAGITTLPDGFQSKEGFLIVDEEFSAGLVTPARIVIDGDVYSEPVEAGIERLETALDSDPAFSRPFQLEVNSSGDLALLSAPVSGDYTGDEAIKAIRTLRNEYIPQAFSGVEADVLVTGQTAANIDYFDLTDDYIPIVFAFVLGLSFVLLTLVFRSLVVPVKAIIMNLLSVGAAYGLMVLVFQKGVGAGILGFQEVDTVEAWIPIFLFCVLFGLSMDYHVFLLSRIRERFDQTHNNSESVAFGLRTTGRVITGAALIMVAVFAGFAAGDLVMFQQMGFGLGVAVFLDATIVRSVLVPAAMQLLGARNWYLPRALQWLPRLYVGESR